MPRRPQNRGNFVSANQKAKSTAVAIVVRAARRARLDYAGFLYVCQQARRKLKLDRPQREHKLPHLLPDSALKRFFQVIQECGDVQHEILLKLLFYTAVRVRELARIHIDDVDLENCRIFIHQGKGPKDRYILFPTSFRLVLRTSGHASKKSLEIYQHLSLEAVEDDYQAAVRGLEI